MAGNKELVQEKDKLIEAKDETLKEKDKLFEEHKRRYEDIRYFEKVLRKMQTMATTHMHANIEDKKTRDFCCEITKVVQSYEGPDDMLRVEQSIRNLGRSLYFGDEEKAILEKP